MNILKYWYNPQQFCLQIDGLVPCFNTTGHLTIIVVRKIIDENERLALSERDSLHVLKLLDTPPAPNDKLMAAALTAAGKW